MAQNEDFQKIGDGLINQFNRKGTPGISPEKENKEENEDN